MTGRLAARTLCHDAVVDMDGAGLPPAYIDRLMESWAFGDGVSAILDAKRVHDVIAGHLILTDDAQALFLTAFETLPSSESLAALEGAVSTWAPPIIPG